MPAWLRSGHATVKYLYAFNILYLVCVVATMVFGVLCANIIDGGKAGHLRGCVFLAISLAAVIFVVTLFGFCGAAIEDYSMIITFAGLLTATIVCEVFAAIVTFITVAGFEPVLESAFRLARDGGDGSALARSFVNDVQTNLKCCGTFDASFWRKIPTSCCHNGLTCNSVHAFGEGCVIKVMWYVRTYGHALGSISIVVACLEVAGVWLAWTLAKEVKKLNSRCKQPQRPAYVNALRSFKSSAETPLATDARVDLATQNEDHDLSRLN